MDNKKIGQTLTKLRGNKAREEVAESLGVSLSAYIKYESGDRTPRDEVKQRIADYYNRTVQFIFFNWKVHSTWTFQGGLNMKYPKPLMSLSELRKLGFSRNELLEYGHMKDSPATRTIGGRKFLFDTEKLEEKRLERK